ncbi:MAG: hypothetical protein C0404_02290 [Verrucomicrobia bacterium]|nr:hypothetical protein [Verrucomicrobiota bacterium]
MARFHANQEDDEMKKKRSIGMKTTILLAFVSLTFVAGRLPAAGSPAESAPPPYRQYAPRAGQLPVAADTNGAPLTLNQCVVIAVAGNPAAAAAKEGVRASQDYAAMASSPHYPTLNAYASYRKWETHAFMPPGLGGPGMAIPEVIGPTPDWSTGVRARWTIFDAGQTRAQVLAARSRSEASGAEAKALEQEIVLNVHRSFFSLVSARQNLAVTETNVLRTAQHLDIASKRRSAGSAVEADVLRAQTQLADARLAAVRAGSLVRLARGNLNASMGLSPELLTEVVPAHLPLVSPDSIDIQAAFETAMAGRPELAAQLFRIAASKRAIATVKSESWPRLQLDGSYGRRDNQFFPSDTDWAVGISLDVPLFSGFSSRRKLAASMHELAAEEARARQVVLSIRQEVWSAAQKLKETREALSASEAFVRDAGESARAMLQRYEAGAATTTDLLDAQTTLTRAEGNLVQARWDYQVSKSTFDRATGAIVVPEGNLRP